MQTKGTEMNRQLTLPFMEAEPATRAQPLNPEALDLAAGIGSSALALLWELSRPNPAAERVELHSECIRTLAPGLVRECSAD